MDTLFRFLATLLSCFLFAAADPCAFNPCMNGGTCDTTANAYVCICPPGWSGTVCHEVAPITDAPSTVATVSGGPSSDAPSSDAPSTGLTTPAAPTTDAPTTLALCVFNPCLNGGTCFMVGESYKCDCTSGWEGVTCDQESAPTAAPTTPTTEAPTTHAHCRFNPCNNGGTCVVVNGLYSCICPPQWTDSTCFLPLTTPDPNPTTTPPPTPLQLLGQAGCHASDVVFTVERGEYDGRTEVDHEADFIKNLVQGWNMDWTTGARLGVLEYGEEVRKHIDLDDYRGNKAGMIRELESLERHMGEQGEMEDLDVAKALDKARDMFRHNPRDPADKIAVAIVHDMNRDATRHFAEACQKLRDQGVTVYAVAVAEHHADEIKILQDSSDHYLSFPSYAALEAAVPASGFSCI